MVYNEIVFWLLFLLFNFILFAFNYIIHFKEADFFPLKTILARKNRGIIQSVNPDFFRFSMDVSILILLTRYGIINKGLIFISIYYIFIFLFDIYHYSFRRIYQINPVIINDLHLLKNGAGILWAESKFNFILYLTLFAGLITTLFTLLLKYLQFSGQIAPNQFTDIIVGLLLISFCLAFLIKGYDHTKGTLHRFIFHFLRLSGHVIDSVRMIRKNNKLPWKVLDKNRLNNIQFNKKPNIYFLFIESYGSVLIRNSKIRDKYLSRFNLFLKGLEHKNWGCKSHLSTSVSLVGPSWLAYTTVLFGSRIDSNFYYEYLLNNDKLYKYDTIFKLLQKQGYVSYNLNATKFKKGVKVPIEQMQRFYGIDRWLLRNDIHYQGSKFGFTEAPPDQYVLNYAFENYLSNENNPFVLFYLTKNSHSPFITPHFVDNWKDWNNTPDTRIGNKFLQKPDLNNFIEAIIYQLDYLQDFIINRVNENDIIFLIGDHQPHDIAHPADGHETLLHVISKDNEFLGGFDNYGFRNSLDDIHTKIKHEAMYSIFTRELIKSYSDLDHFFPEYEPDGLQL